jgi:glutaredoxin
MSVVLILYSKPGCHLCEGLQEKLEQIQSLDFKLEVRDITTREDWFQAYQYEIPVLVLMRSRESGVGSRESEYERGAAENRSTNSESTIQNSIPIPRPSPRATVQQLEQMLRKYL